MGYQQQKKNNKKIKIKTKTKQKYTPLAVVVPYGSWFDYVRAWEDVRMRLPSHRIYVGCYEDMHRDPVGEVSRLAEFLEVGASQDLCRDIASACSFQRMKIAAEKKRGAKESRDFWKPNATGIFRKGNPELQRASVV